MSYCILDQTSHRLPNWILLAYYGSDQMIHRCVLLFLNQTPCRGSNGSICIKVNLRLWIELLPISVPKPKLIMFHTLFPQHVILVLNFPDCLDRLTISYDIFYLNIVKVLSFISFSRSFHLHLDFNCALY